MMKGLMVLPEGAPLSTAVREWASADTGATAIGVVAGIAVGEWLGTALSEYFNLEAGWADVAGKIAGKAALSLVVFVIARRTGGMMRVVLNGAVIGALASAMGDVISQLTATGLGLFGVSASSVKGITVKVNKASAPSIGATSKVITSL